MLSFRRWLSSQLYLWSCRIYEDWHEVELTAEGERIRFCCYGDFTGSWPQRWEFTCSCGRRRRPKIRGNGRRRGHHLTKFWFSVSPAEQRTRFAIRLVDPLRHGRINAMRYLLSKFDYDDKDAPVLKVGAADA